MTTIASGPAADTLARLHAEAAAADGPFRDAMMAEIEASGGAIADVAAKLIADEKADYPGLYRSDHAEHFLNISPEYGQFLYALVRASKARRIVEFGTSMGVSTIYLAAGLRDNGGGLLVGSELAANKVVRAREHVEAAGLGDLVEIREGDALETLQDVAGPIDLVLLDGAWSLYLPVLQLLEPQLGPGALVLGENAFDRAYLDYVGEPANGYLAPSLAVDADRGNQFAVRVG